MINIPMRSGSAFNSSTISNINGLRVTPPLTSGSIGSLNNMYGMNPMAGMGMGAMGMPGMGGNLMQTAAMAAVASEVMNEHNQQNNFQNQQLGNNTQNNFGAGPQNNFGAGPQSNFGAGPQNNFGAQPQNNFGAQPQNNFGAQPQNNFGAQPQNNFDAQPQNNFGAQPQNNFDAQPQNNFGAQPQNNFGAQPQNNFGAQPQNNFGAQPQNNFGAQPQNNFGAQPQNNFGAGPQMNQAPVMNSQPQAAPAPAPAPVKKPIPNLVNQTQKGQKVPLDGVTASSKIKACFGWNTNNGACDVDVSAFMLGANGKVIGDDWFVFYGQPESPDKSTIFANDNGEDREIVTMDLAKLNAGVTKIVFVLTINEALQKNLNFSMLSDAYIRIMDTATNKEIRSFKMDDYYSNVTSMMIGEVYQHNGAWKFNAIGNGVAKDLAGLCELYGVQVV